MPIIHFSELTVPVFAVKKRGSRDLVFSGPVPDLFSYRPPGYFFNKFSTALGRESLDLRAGAGVAD